MTVYIVKSAMPREGKKMLILENKLGASSTILVHRFAMVGPGDAIRVVGTSTSDIRVTLLPENKGSAIPILPHFEMHQDLKFGDERLNVSISEIHAETEFESYRRLEQFHYKGINLQSGSDGIADDNKSKGVGGRRAILVASIQKSGLTRAIGYIELQMPLMMCKPRHKLFSRPFTHKRAKIEWQTWLGDGQKHVNQIARIARVVVDPEFRGLGISPLMIDAAKAFCRERWHIGGVKPIFIEISAEMLRYVDFVSRAGLRYVGDTEGNLQRINKDLHSIENGAGGKSGIMSLQRKYHTAFTTYCKKTGRSFHEARIVLSELLEASDPRSEMASDEWLAFRPILRFPIPYYIAGLDEEADEYIRTGIDSSSQAYGLGSPNANESLVQTLTESKFSEHEDSLEVKGLEVWLDYKIPLTPYVRLVMDSFGIDNQHIRTKLVGPLDININYGNILLITGASGAGKSVVLNALSQDQGLNGLVVHTERTRIPGQVRMLRPLPEGIPIFQYFAETYGADRAFSALCQVGLSEAMIFIKPFEVLSMGQRYRAMFADLILSDAKVWLIDEFCTNLDTVTSKIISIRLRKLAKRSKRFVIVAAANTEHYIKALSPEEILVIRIGGEVKKMKLTEYTNGFYNKGF